MSKKDKLRIPRKLKKKIPEGVYCYVFTGKTSQVWNEEIKQFVTAHHTKVCPFYERIQVKDKKVQEEWDKEYPNEWVSRCRLTGIEDDLCLNDQCKCCGIKDRIKEKHLS